MSEVQKHLFIVRGLPSSGKTSFANDLAKAKSSELGIDLKAHAADDYFYEIGNGEYAFSFEKLGAAHMQCFRRVEKDLSDHGIAIVANTFVKQTDINKYVKLAESYGARVTSLIIEKRHDNKNSHNVPEETMDNMEKSFVIKLR